MTSPPGYRRLAAASVIQARMWAWMRRFRKPWTILDLADAAEASIRVASRYVRRLAEAGYLNDLPSDDRDREESGRYVAREWSLIRDTGPVAPTLTGGEAGVGVTDLNSTMTGAELRRRRQQSGVTVAEFARLIGVRDPRTLRRYEAMERVPAPVAARVGLMSRPPSSVG